MTDCKLDILTIDSKIKDFFLSEYSNLEKYKKTLSELKNTASKNLPRRSHSVIQSQINTLENTIHNIESKENENYYIFNTTELIDDYKKILTTPVRISFTKNIKNKDQINAKNNIIQQYMNVISSHFNLKGIVSPQNNLDIDEIIKTFTDSLNDSKKHKMVCEHCNGKDFDSIEDNIYICNDCCAQKEIFLNTTSYKDVDRVNISSKYSYDRKVHFRDGINQFQGKQNCTIHQSVYDKLEKEFAKHHLLVEDKGAPKHTKFSRIEKEHISMFLKELGLTKHYEDITLIHSVLTGKKPPDISHLEDTLLNEFEMLCDTYDRLFKNKLKRTNFVNTQYVLFQLLRKHNFPCKKDDFVMLKTIDRQVFHDQVVGECFKELNWTHTPLY